MNKLTSTIIKLIVAAVALSGCIYAVVCYWDRLMHYARVGRRLYCHERSRRGHGYRKVVRRDYDDLDLDNTGL